MSNRPPSLKSLRKASTLPQLTLSEAFGRSATVAAGAVAAAKKSDNISSSGDEGSSRGEESDEVVVVEEVAGEVAQAAGSTAVDKPDEVDVVASGGTPNDIGEGYNLASQKWTCLPSSLSSDEKCRLVDHHFVPGPKHDFPVHTGNDGRNRRFRHQWLEDNTMNTWLVYSPKCDRGFLSSVPPISQWCGSGTAHSKTYVQLQKGHHFAGQTRLTGNPQRRRCQAGPVQKGRVCWDPRQL
eukprot:scpid91132/ scgid28668/ 